MEHVAYSSHRLLLVKFVISQSGVVVAGRIADTVTTWLRTLDAIESHGSDCCRWQVYAWRRFKLMLLLQPESVPSACTREP
jgi:hypothetical protein